MTKDDANVLKGSFRGFSVSIDYDFDRVNGWFVRVESNRNNSQYLIKDFKTIIAVGLGSNGIGSERLKISLQDLKNNYLKKGR